MSGCLGRRAAATSCTTTGLAALTCPPVRQVADDIAFPNGMVVTPDNSTLIIAESWASWLTAFDIDLDGSLSNRRVWAEVGGDGICLDAHRAVWCADITDTGSVCMRVREGGEVLQRIELDGACSVGDSSCPAVKCAKPGGTYQEAGPDNVRIAPRSP